MEKRSSDFTEFLIKRYPKLAIAEILGIIDDQIKEMKKGAPDGELQLPLECDLNAALIIKCIALYTKK